jgi:hypothetical protein
MLTNYLRNNTQYTQRTRTTVKTLRDLYRNEQLEYVDQQKRQPENIADHPDVVQSVLEQTVKAVQSVTGQTVLFPARKPWHMYTAEQLNYPAIATYLVVGQQCVAENIADHPDVVQSVLEQTVKAVEE